MLLFSLLLAFSIWLIHNLSLKYSEFIQVPVRLQCELEGHADVSANVDDVIARCQTSGYNILRAARLQHRKPLSLQVTPSVLHSRGGEIFYMTSDDLQEYTHLIFGENVSVEYFLKDTLFFRFPYETFKKVPVRPVYELDFVPQYTIVGEMDVEPDSVIIYGEPYRLEKIDYIYTGPVKLDDIRSEIHGIAKLEQIRGIRFSTDAVRYSADVVRYVEIQKTVPVYGRNVPEDKYMMVYPPYATVRFHCIFPYGGDTEDNVDFYIDYADFIRSRSGRCIARTDDLPDGVIDYSIEPEVFQCVVNDR